MRFCLVLVWLMLREIRFIIILIHNLLQKFYAKNELKLGLGFYYFVKRKPKGQGHNCSPCPSLQTKSTHPSQGLTNKTKWITSTNVRAKRFRLE